MNKWGYLDTLVLAKWPHLHRGVTDDQGKNPQPCRVSFGYYADHALSIHWQNLDGGMLGSPEKGSHCCNKEMAGGSALCWDLRKQQQGVLPAYLGSGAVALLEGWSFCWFSWVIGCYYRMKGAATDKNKSQDIPLKGCSHIMLPSCHPSLAPELLCRQGLSFSSHHPEGISIHTFIATVPCCCSQCRQQPASLGETCFPQGWEMACSLGQAQEPSTACRSSWSIPSYDAFCPVFGY